MKKILSAVFVMTMLVITATFASSVLAADSYQYTPADGLPVVYVSNTGDVNSSIANSNGEEVTTIAAAVTKLGGKSGYIVLLEETDVGRSYTFPSHKGEMITIRGRDDVSEFVKLKARYMCNASGNYTFDNIHLEWYKVDTNDNDQSLQCGTSKVVFGSAGNENSVIVTGMETLTGSNITINGGSFSIRMATWGSNASASDVNIVLNGGTLKSINGAHSGPTSGVYGTDCKGDFCITVNGGTYQPSGLGFGQPANNKFNVGGDYKLVINGGTISASSITPVISGKMPATYNISGNTIVDIRNYSGDKAALAAKFPTASWDIVMANEVFVSDNGDDSAAGTADAPVATYAKAVEKLGAAGGVVSIVDTLTVDSYTEAARTAAVVIADGTLVVNGDFTLGGTTVFMTANIKNGENGAIIAAGNNLTVMADVTTSKGADGKYIDLVAGKRDSFVVVNITVKAGTYNIIDPTAVAAGSKIEIASDVVTVESGVRADDVLDANKLSKGTPTNATLELIDFVNDQQALKIYPSATDVASIEYTARISGKYYKFASFEYYVHILDADTTAIVPELVINGETFVAEQAAAKNGWNIASFDISAIGDTFNEFTFYPYGQNTVASHNKMYVFSINFSQLKSAVAPDYGTISITAGGDFIPVLADFIMNADALVNTSGITNVEVVESPFVVGTATMYKPLADTNIAADYYVLSDGAIVSMRGVFQPYVKVEYYMYAREGDTITAGYPTLKIGAKTYVATEPLVANQWAVATFNIEDYEDVYQSFTFLPYGNASGLNEWNKLYVQQIIFSQAEDKSVPAYSIPDMTEDGELIPYVFDPAAEGLPVHPVIYVNVNGGVLTSNDSYELSINSTKAYGSLSAAFSAANASQQVVYMILVDDVVVGSTGTSNALGYVNHEGNLPSNNNTIIIRGMVKSDGARTRFMVSRMPRTYGPLWFQNVDVIGVSNGDTYLALQGYDISIGTPGGDDNDVIFGNLGTIGSIATVTPQLTAGGDGGSFTKNPVFNIYSGTLPTVLKLSGAYGGTTITGDVTVNVYGGNLSAMQVTNGHSVADKNMGNININIYGGKIGGTWQLVNNSNSYVDGNINVKIAGPVDTSSFSGFSIAPYNINTDNLETGLKGTSTINILEYEGADFEALKSKVSNFNVKFINSVYIKDGGTGDGLTVANACGSLDIAFAACYKENADGSIEGGRVVVCGEGFTIDGVVTAPENLEAILVTSVDDAAIKFQSGTLILNGPINFKNIKFENTNADDAYIAANGNTVLFDTGITGVAAEGKYVSVAGGLVDGTADKVDLTFNSGDFQNVIAGDSVDGDVSIVINGGTIHGDIVGGSSVDGGEIVGNINIILNDGTFEGNVIGANAAVATVDGTTYIEVNGGTFKADSAIIATNANAQASISGNAEIKINGGDFSAMADNNIKAGDGTCGDKICIDYKMYDGDISVIEKKIYEESFDVVVVVLQDKPVFTKNDKFVFIIGHYGDPTAALKKSIPFKITQSAAQTGTPIVVSPKQLNLKVDGNDMMTMTIQTVKDTAETIRLVPNHNPTKGSRMVVDGYNINGRGVDVEKYKYAEIIYYYTVPEGQTPAVECMNINFVGKSAGIPSTKSEALVPNKWASTIIDLTEAFEGKTGALAQYHFDPFGANKKSTDVPADQYIDIISMTFYTDKPHTTIQGGNAPSAKVVEEAPVEKPVIGPAQPTVIEDIVVNVVNLKSTVDNSGAFEAAQVTKDGMTVMEYTPNLDSDKELRIEGYNCMGKAISLNEYQYLTMKIFVETERTDVTFTPTITTQRGGVTDNPEAIKSSATIKSEVNLVPNEWTTVTLKLTPADPAFHITRQFHIMPIGMVKGNAMVAGEKFYLAEFVLSAKPPKAAGSAAGDDEVIIEEVEVIAESPAVVVEGAKLINSSGDFATFKSAVGVYDDKQVVMIDPSSVDAPVSIDGSAIFGNTEQTPDGALSLSTHRYAVISYYYETADTTAARIPEFTLLGGRIQDKGNVVNGVVAKGTEALKVNEWATAVVKLSGNGSGVLTSGFNFRPFGNTSASNLAYGDTLYIESITFVSNRPQ